jgi:formylglycine-generating enzyme required for sulfatase activity
MPLALIPAGQFEMGHGRWEADREWLEEATDRHLVRISRPFYLGAFLVTQREYERVMGANPSSFSPKGEQRDRVSAQDTTCFPVENVSWPDSVQFCQRLSSLARIM